ncbi:aldolase/citrate lyase family protein [Streptomyces narbonensis]
MSDPRGIAGLVRPRTPLTWLYAPGDRPGVVLKALASGADVVIVDLEDAVAPHRKAYALNATVDLLADTHPVPVHVRVHSLLDIPTLAPLPGLCGLRVPKVTHATDIHRIAGLAPGLPLYPLLENALAVEHAYAIATAHPAVRGIALGEADHPGRPGATGRQRPRLATRSLGRRGPRCGPAAPRAVGPSRHRRPRRPGRRLRPGPGDGLPRPGGDPPPPAPRHRAGLPPHSGGGRRGA